MLQYSFIGMLQLIVTEYKPAPKRTTETQQQQQQQQQQLRSTRNPKYAPKTPNKSQTPSSTKPSVALSPRGYLIHADSGLPVDSYHESSDDSYDSEEELEEETLVLREIGDLQVALQICMVDILAHNKLQKMVKTEMTTLSDFLIRIPGAPDRMHSVVQRILYVIEHGGRVVESQRIRLKHHMNNNISINTPRTPRTDDVNNEGISGSRASSSTSAGDDDTKQLLSSDDEMETRPRRRSSLQKLLIRLQPIPTTTTTTTTTNSSLSNTITTATTTTTSDPTSKRRPSVFGTRPSGSVMRKRQSVFKATSSYADLSGKKSLTPRGALLQSPAIHTNHSQGAFEHHISPYVDRTSLYNGKTPTAHKTQRMQQQRRPSLMGMSAAMQELTIKTLNEQVNTSSSMKYNTNTSDSDSDDDDDDDSCYSDDMNSDQETRLASPRIPTGDGDGGSGGLTLNVDELSNSDMSEQLILSSRLTDKGEYLAAERRSLILYHHVSLLHALVVGSYRMRELLAETCMEEMRHYLCDELFWGQVDMQLILNVEAKRLFEHLIEVCERRELDSEGEEEVALMGY